MFTSWREKVLTPLLYEAAGEFNMGIAQQFNPDTQFHLFTPSITRRGDTTNPAYFTITDFNVDGEHFQVIKTAHSEELFHHPIAGLPFTVAQELVTTNARREKNTFIVAANTFVNKTTGELEVHEARVLRRTTTS